MKKEKIYIAVIMSIDLEAGNVVAYINYPGMGSRSSILKMITGYNQEKEIDVTASLFSQNPRWISL
jgi:ABC-type hemin transport system ATPase subunit